MSQLLSSLIVLIALVHVVAIPTPADLITNSNNLYQAQPADQVVPEATGELAPELIQSTAAKWKNFAAAMSRATSADEMNDAHTTIFGPGAVPEVAMVDTRDTGNPTAAPTQMCTHHESRECDPYHRPIQIMPSCP